VELNIKLANQLLKVRRKKKLERDQKIQQENIIAQTQANTQAQQAAAQMEIQKKQSESESMQQLEEIKAGFESQRMMQETELKKQLMDHEFEIKIRIAKLEADAMKSKEDGKEDRKDERTKIQATQQSELIDQRKNDSPPKDFESQPEGMPGGFGLGM
jgi:thiol:disulfide interchange protein